MNAQPINDDYFCWIIHVLCRKCRSSALTPKAPWGALQMWGVCQEWAQLALCTDAPQGNPHACEKTAAWTKWSDPFERISPPVYWSLFHHGPGPQCRWLGFQAVLHNLQWLAHPTATWVIFYSDSHTKSESQAEIFMFYRNFMLKYVHYSINNLQLVVILIWSFKHEAICLIGHIIVGLQYMYFKMIDKFRNYYFHVLLFITMLDLG